MTTTSSLTNERVAAFAASVREALSDLPADEVEDLVDGLEADLSDQLSESEGDMDLGDPIAYAAELRSAAGVPARVPAEQRGQRLREYVRRLEELDARVWQSVRSSRLGAWTIDTLVALRPVWWVARGWVIYVLLAPLAHPDPVTVFAPGDRIGAWALLVALVVLSVQWGRRLSARPRWAQVVSVVVSTVTAIALPFVIGAAGNSVQQAIADAYTVENTVIPGLAVDGERVRNIYAYDAQGHPLERVQLFDQDGDPLTTVGGYLDDSASWDESVFGTGGPIPVAWENGGDIVWNVFPLKEAPADEAWEDEPDADDASDPPFPFVMVPPLEGAPTPSPTPAP